MLNVPPTALTVVSAVALLYGVARVLMLLLRARRHRRLIRHDLDQRKCHFGVARRRRGRLLARQQTYDVEYTDPESDVVAAACTLDRGGAVKWDENDGVPGPFNQLVPSDLPEYGQNWRG